LGQIVHETLSQKPHHKKGVGSSSDPSTSETEREREREREEREERDLIKICNKQNCEA
jgi:hypothetical protein